MSQFKINAEKALAILREAGTSDYIGENVTQLEHSLQAAHFAQRSGATEVEILAALFHDIGHLCAPSDAPQMSGLGVVDHENIGARFLLNLGFSPQVAELVAAHVSVKRYLVAKNPAYAARLSEASAGTLRHQGGPMSPEEADAFERDPAFRSKVRVRQWDEMAKVPAMEVASLESYRASLEQHLASQSMASTESRQDGPVRHEKV